MKKILTIAAVLALGVGAAQAADLRKVYTKAADSDEVARVYRYEVARGFRDDVAHLSDLISPGGEAF